ncbi:hypothetical protein WJX84_001154 [Apatococcus fuscideae]|uniref:Uncharacterized protein n=1 Tax=Apatococcus fuscideae TaxID=2026836 RepID=A0AAW1T0T0_9CHLO
MATGARPTHLGSPRGSAPVLSSNGAPKHVVFSGDERGVDERPASATADSVPASQQQSQDLVKDVKQSVAELRVLVKDAVSHREKCCTVLSSALAVSLALEQVIYSGPMTSSRAKKLQRLSADTISNITLAGHCVKVRAVSDLS